MPLVIVNRGTTWVPTEELFSRLVDRLPEIIANALTCENPDGKLTPADIEVWVRRSDSKDIVTDKIQIVVFASLFPERAANLDARQKIINDRIKEILRGTNFHGWVWIRLAPSSFGEF
ncbi:MAG: hypothetical protein AAB451_03670 [Patescibacteria group bacterium]